MTSVIPQLWQLNIEISLLLLAVLCARQIVRKTTKIYNAYLLWLSVPLGLLAAALFSKLKFSEPPVEAVGYLVQNYVIQPANEYSGLQTLGGIWAAIALGLLIRLGVQHYQLRRDLAAITAPTSIASMSKYPVIGIDRKDFSPAVYGFLKPRIYFPIQLEQSLSRDQIELIIQHEEHHVSQQHLWLNLLWDIVVCLMWFNPLAYLSRQNFRHDQELFCDYLVLNKSSQNAHRSYGHALLTTVTATHSLSLLCSWKTFNQLEERIMNIKRPSSIASKVAITLAGMLVISATSIYSVSAEQYATYSFRHHVDDDGNSDIEWKADGVTFIERNGKAWALEGDQRRALSDAEKTRFQTQIDQSYREWLKAEQDLEKEQVDRWSEQLASESSQQELAMADREREQEIRRQAQAKRQQEQAKRQQEHAKRQQEHAKRQQEHAKRQQEHAERQQEQAKRAREREHRQLERQAHQQERQVELAMREAERKAHQAEREHELERREHERQTRKVERELEIERRQAERERKHNEKQHELARREAERARRSFEKQYERERGRVEKQAKKFEEHYAFNYQTEMEAAERALQEALVDIEGSLRSGDLSSERFSDLRNELEQARQDIASSRWAWRQQYEHNTGEPSVKPSSPKAPIEPISPIKPTTPEAPEQAVSPVQPPSLSRESSDRSKSLSYDMRVSQ